MEPEVFDAASGMMFITYQTFVVRTPRYTILVDTCTGEDKGHPPPFDFPGKERWRKELFALGVSYEKIDYVFCTHLHIDHTGWNTTLRDGRWVPTFPNAKYLMPGREVEARDPKRGAADKAPAVHQPFIDSVQPVLDAGLATLLNGDEKLNDEIEFMPIPGHAPGQMGIRLRSAGEQALFIGDVMHQPIQVVYPDWNSKYCENPEIARRTRHDVLAYCAAHNALLLPVHFGAPHCGRVLRRGDRYSFSPAPALP